jgi:hypothetical protein
MAFKRIVANSEEDLKTIMSNIKNWFKETNDYKTEFSTEKRKFQDPDTKAIVEKNIDVIKATDTANDKFSTIKFIPMKEKGEMKVEIGGEGEAAVSGKISNQMKGKGKFKSYSKDKKVALKENDTKKPEMTDDELMKKIKSSLSFQVSGGKKGKPGLKEALDRRIANIFFKYKDKSFPMDYKPGSVFAKFIGDLEESGAFSSDDEVSDFMSSEEFDMYANKFGVEIDYADYDPTPLELADKEPINPQDMIPGRAPKDFISADLPHRVTDLLEKLKKTGKLKPSELKEIIKKFNK